MDFKPSFEICPKDDYVLVESIQSPKFYLEDDFVSVEFKTSQEVIQKLILCLWSSNNH
jgi:hypothetical protein